VDGDTFLVATVARLDPVKHLETLIEAVALVRSNARRVELLVIGDGPERPHLEASAHAAGVADRVRFAGHRSDVRELLPAADVFVNCSTSEGISLTILEAMASRLPVVATRVGGTPEVVIDGVTGLLVPPRAPAAVADALSALSRDPDRRAALGIAGRDRVERSFSIEQMVGQYEQAYLAASVDERAALAWRSALGRSRKR